MIIILLSHLLSYKYLAYRKDRDGLHCLNWLLQMELNYGGLGVLNGWVGLERAYIHTDRA